MELFFAKAFGGEELILMSTRQTFDPLGIKLGEIIGDHVEVQVGAAGGDNSQNAAGCGVGDLHIDFFGEDCFTEETATLLRAREIGV